MTQGDGDRADHAIVPEARKAPGSLLFLCGMNSIRSPMAECIARKLLPPGTYIASAGVRPGERDPFVDAVLDELGLSLGQRLPRLVDDLEDDYFDLIVALAPQAHHRALDMTRTQAVDVEYWATADPTIVRGTRDQILGAYRDVRDGLERRIRERFGADSSLE